MTKRPRKEMNLFNAKVVSLANAAELASAPLYSYKLENDRYYWQQGKFEEKYFTDVYMALFNKAIVNHIFQVMLPEDGLFIDNETYEDALKWFPAAHNYYEKDDQMYFECPIEKEIVHINEPTFLIGGHSNVWHWLQNWLPRVAIGEHFEKKGILPNFKNMKILVHGSLLPAQTESLLLLGFKEENILFNNGQQFYQFENLYVTSFFHNNAINSFIPKFYMEKFQHLLEPNESYPKRIYISRQKEKRRRRRIQNSDKLELLLKKYDFKILYCEELSFVEQMLYFYNAEITLGGHGAGLVNILFSRSRTNFILYEYKSLSEYQGLAYIKNLVTNRIITKQYIDEDYEKSNPDFDSRLRDFIVDLEKTEAIIKAAIAGKGKPYDAIKEKDAIIKKKDAIIKERGKLYDVVKHQDNKLKEQNQTIEELNKKFEVLYQLASTNNPLDIIRVIRFIKKTGSNNHE